MWMKRKWPTVWNVIKCVRNDTKQLWWRQQECESRNETCICEYNGTNCDGNNKCAIRKIKLWFDDWRMIWETCAELILWCLKLNWKKTMWHWCTRKTLQPELTMITNKNVCQNTEIDCDRWCVYRNLVCLCCDRWRNPKPICGNIFQSSVTLWTLILIMRIMWLKGCVWMTLKNFWAIYDARRNLPKRFYYAIRCFCLLL